MMKTMLPPEQQGTLDMAAAMMSMMQMGEGENPESESEPEEEAREEGQDESVNF